MSKVLAVFGATGQQGSSVVNFVLSDPELSWQYKLRAITRNADSDKAQQLKAKNVEVVSADVADRASIEKALTGAHTVFAMTTPAIGPDALQVELGHAKTVADVAVAQGVSYLIWSTLPNVKEISGGKLSAVTAFDAKAEAEAYIRTLPIHSAFYCPGSFMENFAGQAFIAPYKEADGTWVLARHLSAQAGFPLIDAVGDGGKFVGAILADPDKFEGKRLCAATAVYTLQEIVDTMSRVSGKKVVYKQIPEDEFRKSFPAGFADMFIEALTFYEEYGYFGPGTEELVAQGAAQARGKLSTFEEFLRAHPLPLE